MSRFCFTNAHTMQHFSTLNGYERCSCPKLGAPETLEMRLTPSVYPYGVANNLRIRAVLMKNGLPQDCLCFPECQVGGATWGSFRAPTELPSQISCQSIPKWHRKNVDVIGSVLSKSPIPWKIFILGTPTFSKNLSRHCTGVIAESS